MTKRTLLTTASVAVLAIAFASSALAEPNDFANLGEANVNIANATVGGAGGDGGAGGNPTDANTNGGNGGDGGQGGAGGIILNNVNANSGNTYTEKSVNVSASNHQTATSGGSIDTSGGYNKQRGGSASGTAETGVEAQNENVADLSGGTARGSEATAGNSADTSADGGIVLDNDDDDPGSATGDASAHATGNGGPQAAGAQSGNTTGGDGGIGSNQNATLSGEALASATGGNTSGDQNANGGTTSSGVMDVDGMANTAGAFALNAASGAYGVGNSANAVAARVNTINTF